MKSSKTDWIQAVAVVIGVAFAIWGLVIQDRAAELSKKEAVFQLILAGGDESLTNSLKELSKELPNLNKDDIDELRIIELSAIYTPFEQHYNSWGFCFENDLCKKELTLRYVCEGLISFNNITKMI